MNTQHIYAASWLLASVATFSASALAYTQHEAHVHGQAELNIAQDGHDLLLEMTAPAADVVGFEHPPETAQEQAALKQARQSLNQPAKLFQLNATAGCQLQESQISDSFSVHAEETDEHDHHDDHEHDDHAHHHEHAEFSVQYVFRCDTINKLKFMNLAWFTVFPSTENIQVQAITDKGQQATTLHAAQPVFHF